MVEWHGATKFKISWQFSVDGTANKHSICDTPSTISVRSLKNHQKKNRHSQKKVITIFIYIRTLTFSYKYE